MPATSSFPCTNCGAELTFAPGTDALACPYCGTENAIDAPDVAIKERDFEVQVSALQDQQEVYEVQTVRCDSCGAESTLDDNVSSDLCPFCGTSMVLTEHTQRLIKPQGVLPFKVKDAEAHAAFREWLGGLWFAPNDLKQYARQEGRLAGMYLPYWTFDTEATTQYRGRRGEYYYETETYTDDEGNTRTRRVRRTRWYPARGTVHTAFDDVLVVASDGLPRPYLRKLEPWDLDALRPYADEYLSGFRTESYTVELDEGYRIAQERMQPTIDRKIRRDIGGDTQQITSKASEYDDTTFKHILLPVWLTAYRYGDDVYRIMINARTGEVQGERPWSAVKIALAVAAVVLVGLAIWVLNG
ncbi:MAG: hypothetical protein GVY35_09620 [Bacteroidetes bacterium]|jgi:predicted RNA-binding Zn-ribbon protein involved in translation (DUF1610 family)|nr:hypothetical protein [Bacteroidota bacterium]